VLGASFDTPAENKAFADAQRFGFRLLSDVDREVGGYYEVLRGPNETYPDYPLRIAYLIDREGIVRHAYDVTDVKGFAADVLSDLERLQRHP
jgi:thioredoxin-dependent peroxiredoxin